MIEEPSERLPPFPDRLLVPGQKENVLAWIRGLDLPIRHAARALRQWAAYVGVELQRSDYVAVRRPPRRSRPET